MHIYIEKLRNKTSRNININVRYPSKIVLITMVNIDPGIKKTCNIVKKNTIMKKYKSFFK